MRIAAAQTPVFWEDVDGALTYARQVIAEAQAVGATLLCFPEGFLQGYLVEPEGVRRQALDLASSAFADLVARLPSKGPPEANPPSSAAPMSRSIQGPRDSACAARSATAAARTS